MIHKCKLCGKRWFFKHDKTDCEYACQKSEDMDKYKPIGGYMHIFDDIPTTTKLKNKKKEIHPNKPSSNYLDSSNSSYLYTTNDVSSSYDSGSSSCDSGSSSCD